MSSLISKQLTELLHKTKGSECPRNVFKRREKEDRQQLRQRFLAVFVDEEVIGTSDWNAKIMSYTMEQWIAIGFTIVGGALFGLLMHYLYQLKRGNTAETDRFQGRMNTAGIRKNRVIFSPEVCENDVITLDTDEKTESESNSDEQEDEQEDEEELEDEEDDDEEEEEQMPQFNKRKIKNYDADMPSTSETQEKELSDGDKINATIGKLHGKLATAQLKAKTRQIAAEMSEQEKAYEAQMTNNQMESIMRLMMQNQEKFGMSSEDIKEQMNLYNF
uniref:Matrix-remodeling-associated protein 7 n=1 Tax=Caenorhabditis tropicalis TaxID=1561998 RepID=A0A1I7TMZ8_9PELO